MPLIASLVIGLATGFVSILSTLKATSNKETFITSILVNSDGTAPIVITKDLDFSSRLSSVGMLLVHRRQSEANRPFDMFNDVLAAEQTT